MTLKNLISSVENHTKEKFDINNRRHFRLLNDYIERLNSEQIRKYFLIKEVLNSSEKHDSLFNNTTHYLVKRRSS